MKVLHVVAGIADQASGPSYTVPALCESLVPRCQEVSLHVLAPPPLRRTFPFETRSYPAWPILTRLGISPVMKRALSRAAPSTDIMHNHGLWMMPNVYPARAVQGTKCRLVFSPHGMVSAWALRRSRWRKRLMWFLCQGRAVRATACFHAMAESEFLDIRAAGLKGPVAVIPIGVDVPLPSRPHDRPGQSRRLLYLGRIHPSKGIDNLVKAWRSVQVEANDWELHVVGPDNNGHLRELENLAQAIGAERIFFPGPVFGEDKAEAYRRADLFVLPTHSDNFGMVVAEALAHGVPAIVTKGAPWQGLEEHRCGWWIDRGDGPLTDSLRSVLRLSSHELRSRGERGRAWVARDFSWDAVGQAMFQTYLWLLGGGTPPSCVRP